MAQDMIYFAADEADRMTYEDAWRAAFTPPDPRTGVIPKNYWQWNSSGHRSGQAYFGSDLYAPIGELSARTINNKINQQRSSEIIRIIADIHASAPELLDELTDADRQRIRGLRATRLWIAGLEKQQASEEPGTNIFKNATATKRERMRGSR